MNLKKKIITSLLILVLLPVVMLTIGFICVFAYQDTYSEQRYGTGASATEAIANPVKILEKLTSGSYTKMLEVSKETPDKLLDKDYIREMENKLDTQYSFIVVRKEDEYVYIGNESLFNTIDCDLPAYGEGLEDNQLLYESGEQPILLKQIDFVSTAGEKASAFIVINMSKIIPQIKSLAFQLIFQIVVIVVCTAIILIMWLYKSMLQPLNALSKAAKRISDGDLNFEMTDFTHDEIGTLCEDFEVMRRRLKENIDKQQLYEQESRILISNISHDLKTPLTAIKGYSEGLMDGIASTKEKQHKYLSTIYKKADDMTALVDELSLYAKIGMDAIPYNFLVVNVSKYYEDCVDEIKNETELLDINIGYSNTVDNDVYIQADPEQLKRVIDNIISNSVKYMDKKPGEINISISENDNQEVVVCVSDNGKGIAKEDIVKIFDRFYRADSSRNSKQGGTGLGLAISKKIIEDHGGVIAAYSQEGQGTTISFTIKKYIKNKQDTH